MTFLAASVRVQPQVLPVCSLLGSTCLGRTALLPQTATRNPAAAALQRPQKRRLAGASSDYQRYQRAIVDSFKDGEGARCRKSLRNADCPTEVMHERWRMGCFATARRAELCTPVSCTCAYVAAQDRVIPESENRQTQHLVLRWEDLERQREATSMAA